MVPFGGIWGEPVASFPRPTVRMSGQVMAGKLERIEHGTRERGVMGGA
jgi:hypothetical protein